MPVVFVIAEEWMLRAGIRAELRERGIQALGMENADEVGRALASSEVPAAVVLDQNASAASDPAVLQLTRRVPTVLIASRTLPSERAATRVLLRPVQIKDVVAAVTDLLRNS